MLRGLLAAVVVLPLIVLGWLGLGETARRADFVVASDQLRLIDPHRVSFADEIQTAQSLFEGLTRLNDRTLAPEPAVAESWETDADGLVWTFRIRPGACWSNGEPVEADHFRVAWLRVLHPAAGAQYASLLFVLDGAERFYRTRLGDEPRPASELPDAESVAVEVLDSRTLRLRLAAPCPALLELLTLPVFAPVYPPALEAFAFRGGRVLRETQHLLTRPENLVCNGPFVLRRWDFKQRLLLARNPHYWDRDAIDLETIEIYLSGDQNSGLIAYETGRVDLLRGLDGDVARRLAEAGAGRSDLRVGDRFATFFLRVNCRRAPLDNADLRKALSLAIDREAICRHLLGLGETPALTYIPRGALPLLERTADDGSPVGYRPPAGLGAGLDPAARLELAREHLKRSGFGSTQPARAIEIAYAPEPAAFRRVMEALQAGWERDLGLKIEARMLESKVLSERIRRLDYDLARSNWFGDYLDPAAFLEMFTTVSGQNRTGWSHAGYDERIAAALAARDPRERYAHFAEAEAILCEQGLPIIPIYHMRGNFLLRPGFTNLADSVRPTGLIHRVRRGPAAAGPG